jgi:hypothetical protein
VEEAVDVGSAAKASLEKLRQSCGGGVCVLLPPSLNCVGLGIQELVLGAVTAAGTSTSSISRRVIRTSPLSVGRGPRAGSVITFTGQSMGMSQPTASRLGWPRPWILPPPSTLRWGTEITLADSGSTTAWGRTRRSNSRLIHPLPKKRPGSR